MGTHPAVLFVSLSASCPLPGGHGGLGQGLGAWGRPVLGSGWARGLRGGGALGGQPLGWAALPLGSPLAVLLFAPAPFCWDHPFRSPAVTWPAQAGEGFSYWCRDLFLT